MPRSPKLTIVDDGDPKKYWAQVPNIVCDLGLPSQALALYLQIKRVAGEGGTCYKSTRTLALALKVSTGTVVRAKALLERDWPQLGNKPLIRTIEKPNPRGGKPYHEIRVTDIWHANMKAFTSATIELDNQVPEFARQVPRSRKQVPEPSATIEHKNNPPEEEPNKKTPQEEVFEFWVLHLNHPRAVFDEKRRKAVAARLRDGYSVADLILAVRGCKLTPHNMGENDRQEIFDDLELICRDTPHVERFIARVEVGVNGNGHKPKTASERNIANLRDGLALFSGRGRPDNLEEPPSFLASNSNGNGK